MKQKLSISIILTLMLAVIDSWTLLNAEDQPSSNEKNVIAKVIEVNGDTAFYKRSKMKKWEKLSNKRKEYEKIRFYNYDLVKVEKLSQVTIECITSTKRLVANRLNPELNPGHECPPQPRPE